MAIVGRRRSTTHPLAGRSAAEDGGGETFLPREEWAKPRGRKSRRRRCGSGDRGAAVLRLDQAKERPCGRTPNSILGRRRGRPEGVLQRVPASPGEETAAMGQKKEASSPRPIGAGGHLPHGVHRPRRERSRRSAPARVALLEGPEHNTSRRASPTRRSGRRGRQRFWPCAASKLASEPGLRGMLPSDDGTTAKRENALMPARMAPMIANACCHPTVDMPMPVSANDS